MHCNDSKTRARRRAATCTRTSARARSAAAGFEALLAHPALRDVPFLLEVPGYKLDGAGKGPDKPNIDLAQGDPRAASA